MTPLLPDLSGIAAADLGDRERCNFSAFWSHATHLHTLSLGFLVCEMGPVIIPHNSVVLGSSAMTRDTWQVAGVQ